MVSAALLRRPPTMRECRSVRWCLVAFAREQHFARAAECCHVTRSALSEAIRRLEHELDVTLVERDHRFNGLTGEGQRVLGWARTILAAHRGLESGLSAMRGRLVGTLHIGVIPSALAVQLTEAYDSGSRAFCLSRS